MNASARERWLPLVLIMLAVGGWGIFHAVGAYSGARPVGASGARGLIVLVSFAGFLALWLAALAVRAGRGKRN